LISPGIVGKLAAQIISKVHDGSLSLSNFTSFPSGALDL
jgi:hypothetical protein